MNRLFALDKIETIWTSSFDLSICANAPNFTEIFPGMYGNKLKNFVSKFLTIEIHGILLSTALTTNEILSSSRVGFHFAERTGMIQTIQQGQALPIYSTPVWNAVTAQWNQYIQGKYDIYSEEFPQLVYTNIAGHTFVTPCYCRCGITYLKK